LTQIYNPKVGTLANCGTGDIAIIQILHD
jgi:hypothetical protein